MLISDLTSGCAVECTEDTPVEDVYHLIQKCDHGFVVVVDSLTHRVPIGVVNEHSICEQIIGRQKNPRGLTAGSVMQSRILKLPADKPAAEAASSIVGIRPSAIVAVDGKGAFIGVVAYERLAAAVEAPVPMHAAAGQAAAQAAAGRADTARINRIF